MLGMPRVDYALSSEKIDEAVGALRLEILQRVQVHLADFGKATGRTWRIGDIAFGTDEPGHYNEARTGKGAYRDNNDLLRSLEESDAVQGLSGMERIKLLANVTLRAMPDHGLPFD